MSSVIRVISASGSDVALFSMSTSSRLRIGSSVMRKSSCEYFLRLGQSARQAFDLVFGTIEPKRRPACRRDAEAIEQRHHAMGAGAHGDARTVDDGRDIMRMRALHLERHDRPLVLGIADDAQRIDRAKPLARIFDQLALLA